MAKVIVTKNTYTIEPVYQWDVNQVLEIHGMSFAIAPEVHFAHEGAAFAIVRSSTMDAAGVIRAKVPNSLLQKAQRIHAYLCTYEGDAFQTVYKIDIPVKQRNRPGDYTEVEEFELYDFSAMDVEVITLEPGVDATVEKVLRGDKIVLRFGIPVTADVYGDVTEATRAAEAAAQSEKNASAAATASSNSASAAQQAKQAAETARNEAEAFANSLPTVTEADNGKVLGVVDGKVALVTPSYPVVTQDGTKLSIE